MTSSGQALCSGRITFAPCEICNRESHIVCPRCGIANYCSTTHQILDWDLHIDFCKLLNSVKVDRNAELGEHLVASCDIPANYLFATETPIVMGPTIQGTADKLICVICLRTPVDKECENCGWSVCSLSCSAADVHKAECRFVHENCGMKIDIKGLLNNHPIYKYLIIIRCLCLKESDPELWMKLLGMKSELSNRFKNKALTEVAAVYMADSIIKIFKLGSSYMYNDLVLVCRIVQVNAFIVNMDNYSYTVLYCLSSLVGQSCVPNITRTFSDSGEIFMKTLGPVGKNEPLVMTCADVFLGTVPRRQQLVKLSVDCRCRRCKDRTELGTFYSAIHCQRKNCYGVILLDNPLEEDSTWSCTHCKLILPPVHVSKLIEKVSHEVSSLDFHSLNDCENMLEHLCQQLHRNHYILMPLRV